MRDYGESCPNIENLVAFFKKDPDVITVYIFGSFGTTAQTPLSDLDLAVLFAKEVSLMEELHYTAEVSAIMQMEKVDLINLNTTFVQLQHEVLYRGEIIFERAPGQTQDFVENVLEIYHDYEFILKKYREDFHQGLMEDYLNG